MIFETHEISIEEAKKKFEPLGFDIYCLGMPKENTENLMMIMTTTENHYK